MAETVLSPGVYLNENDQSFVTQGVVSTGAVIVGPTNKGPAFVPTVVRSTKEFQNKFGNSLQYKKTVTYIPQTINTYLNSGAGSVMVVRVLGGGGFSFPTATRKLAALVISSSAGSEIATVLYPSLNTDAGIGLSGSLLNSVVGAGGAMSLSDSFNLTLAGTAFTSTDVSASLNINSSDYILSILGDAPNNVIGGNDNAFAYLNFRQRQSSSLSDEVYLVTSSADIEFTGSTAEGYDHGRTPWITSGNSAKNLFKFHHRGDGFDTNGDVYISITDLREPADVNGEEQYTSFTVLVRKVGSDEQTNMVLESYTDCNLNPESPGFIGRAIGDRYEEYNTSLGKVLTNGDYANASQFVRIEVSDDVKAGALSPKLSPRGHGRYYDVGGFAPTYNLPSASLQTEKIFKGFYNPNVYLGFDITNPDNFNYLKPVPKVDTVYEFGANVDVFNIDTLNGHISASWTGSLSASVDTAGFSGPTGQQLQFSTFMQFGNDGIDYSRLKNVGTDITPSNAFGFDLSSTSAVGGAAYKKVTDILSNKDRYDFNILATPGVIDQHHSAVNNQTLNMVAERADAIFIMDLEKEDASVRDAKLQTAGLDSSYAAVYYPWVQMLNDNSAPEYFPPSVVMPGVYHRSDTVSGGTQPWFAPAGLTRGGIPRVIQAKNPLTKTERDILYDERVNPIATFPSNGVVVFGQKTLQRAASALDRVNVRRLLINVKKYVDAQSRFLVFEQNSAATRQRFLDLVNPYMQSIQERQGVYAYRVQMDESNNTPDVIDRNELVGAIFLQPTKTAEFIKIDFNIQATGAQI